MATKIAFGLFSATNILVWSLLAWVIVEDALRSNRAISSLIPLLIPATAIVACFASVRFRKYDWGGAFAFAMLFAALPRAMLLGGGV